MTQEEIMAKVMSDPEIMIAFQNPKIQKAIMDVSSRSCRGVVKWMRDAIFDLF